MHNLEKLQTKKSSYKFFVGSYTDKKSKGIYKYSLDENGNIECEGLYAETSNPSFLAMSNNKKFLISVNENEIGTIESYKINPDRLELLSSKPSGGADPCFVTTNTKGHILVANYSSGNIGFLTIDEKGFLSDLLDVQQHNGSCISERQKQAHAHSAWFVPDSNDILSLDLGTNELWISEININQQEFIPKTQSRIRMEQGAGPRHLVFHPNNNCIYVLNELNATITIIEKIETGTYKVGQSISTLPSDFNGLNLCAEIQISEDGQFLYASNRGHDSIAIFSIAKDNTLKVVGHQSTYGKEPRNFSLSPNNEFLIVANQISNTIVSFKRDKNTGKLKHVFKAEAFSPVHVLFE